ncbi:MerR family transcriptional regulator [Microbacterium rhizomatis]|uniref:MerR family transcriptional regulator n=1 Tax=Microbacterium rhizomatis TaxID=1631477 RepID=A0A5J5J2N5_9MICO|nr:MerR family transcriptional regulator [Microbacterium rhizomatis]KAA9107610.1 MerR family transcriptional regulator [Microbacterium rhizomatis]
MRISELSARADVAVPTIKYYLREGLLPEGQRTSATQATYSDVHVERLRVVRALIEAGVSIAESRRVLTALDAPHAAPQDLLAAAHAAVTPAAGEQIDLTTAQRLVERIGWHPGMCDDGVLAGIAVALDRLDRAGFEVPADVMPVYLESIQRIARAEIAGVPTDSTEAAVRYVVLGSVLVEPLLLALRRAAEQIASAERFFMTPGSDQYQPTDSD